MNNILFIGFGSITIKHLNNVNRLNKKSHFYILSKKKNIKLNNVNKNKVTFIENLKSINKIKISHILICNGSNGHLKYLNLLKNVSKKIFIEKPISNNFSKLKKISIKNFKSHKIQIGYNFFFLKILKFIKEYFKNSNEKIQKVSVKAGYYLPYWRKDLNYHNSVTANKKLGGGVLLELSHEISYILWLLGRPKTVSGFITKNSKLKIDTEDTALINFEYKNFNCSFDLDIISKYYDRYCKIDTDKHSYIWNYKNNSFIKKNGNITKKIYSKKFDLNESYLNEIKYFLSSKRNFSDLIFKNSIDTLKVIDEVKKSSKQNGLRLKIKYDK